MDTLVLKAQVRTWKKASESFARPHIGRALFQLFTTLGLYFLNVAAAGYLLWSGLYPLLPVCVPACGLLTVRLFIIQHDCGHHSFLPSTVWNDRVGHMLSFLTFTPYQVWRKEHAQHHAGSADLDRRGVGDIKLLTVREYESLPLWGRIRYRVLRNPFFLICIGGPVYFGFLLRVPWGRGISVRESWKNIVVLDLALLSVFVILIWLTGLVAFFLTVVLVLYIASCIGVGLFYVQHQFEEVEWYRRPDWDYGIAAIYGSSYLVLPRILAWFTADIGIHHLHHLNPRIPNYNLRRCLAHMPDLAQLNILTLGDVLDCFRKRLWDEERRELVGFR